MLVIPGMHTFVNFFLMVTIFVGDDLWLVTKFVSNGISIFYFRSGHSDVDNYNNWVSLSNFGCMYLSAWKWAVHQQSFWKSPSLLQLRPHLFPGVCWSSMWCLELQQHILGRHRGSRRQVSQSNAWLKIVLSVNSVDPFHILAKNEVNRLPSTSLNLPKWNLCARKPKNQLGCLDYQNHTAAMFCQFDGRRTMLYCMDPYSWEC